ALELAPDAPLAERTRLALRRAGDGAFSVNGFGAAVQHYETALELWPEDDSERPQLQLQYGRALYRASGSRADVLVAARDGLLAAGGEAAAAEAEIMLAELASYVGEHDRASDHVERALELVEAKPASWAKALVLSRAARTKLVQAELEAAADLA